MADTTFLVDLSVGDEAAVWIVASAEAAQEVLATTFINAYEYLLGNARRKGASRERGQAFINHLLILSGDYRSAVLSSQAGVQLLGRGEMVSTTDLLIAGIAMREGAVLLTRDQDFARIPGLAVKNY